MAILFSFAIFVLFYNKIKVKYFISIIIIFFILSFIFAEWTYYYYSTAGFYLIFSRGFEIIAGILLAFYSNNKKNRLSNNHVAAFLSLLGLVIVVSSIFLFDESIASPNHFNLLTVIGVILILYFTIDGNITHKILSNYLLVSLGLISYSLYLWHQPLFAFAKYYNVVSLSSFEKISILFLSLILSIVTYFLIERPFRNKSLITRKLFYLFLVILLFILIFFSIHIKISNGSIERFDVIKQNAITSAVTSNKQYWYCSDNVDLLDVPYDGTLKCLDETKKVSWVSFGDSQIVDISFQFSKLLENRNETLKMYAYAGCLPNLVIKENNKCNRWARKKYKGD